MGVPGDSGRVGNKVIIGTWVWTRESNNCTEVWRFYDDGKYVVVSGREVTLGEYSISEWPNEASRYAMTMTILVDHGGKDCADTTDDSSGATYMNYLQFHESGNAYAPMYHETESDGFGPLYRISE